MLAHAPEMAKKRKIFTYGYADADSNLRALR
jgi:hypothetical protein